MDIEEKPTIIKTKDGEFHVLYREQYVIKKYPQFELAQTFVDGYIAGYESAEIDSNRNWSHEMGSVDYEEIGRNQ